MQIAPVSYQPYVYKPNAIDSNSLSRVKPIGDDLLASKTDFSGMTEAPQETTNPLRRGETANFADVLMSQMQMGWMNADRLFNPVAQGVQEISQRVAQVETETEPQADNSAYQMQRAMDAYQFNMTA